MVQMCRVTGDPLRWLERWLHEKGFSDTERLAHEMRPLCEILHHAATYDQLNLGGTACLEVAARRLQAIVDAHAVSASRPNWSVARYYGSSVNTLDVSSEAMKKYATRMAKDEWDLQVTQNRIRELRGAAGSGDKGVDKGVELYMVPLDGDAALAPSKGARGGGGGRGGDGGGGRGGRARARRLGADSSGANA
jgi:hypothetical protein